VKQKTKKREKKNVAIGKAFIQATYNNTIISITDMSGDVISWASAGGEGFKGSRKSTPFAAQMAAKTAAQKAIDVAGMKSVEVYVKGPGIGRESAIRSILQTGIDVTKIKDETPVPHNGCRPRKRRRV
jgi:small subunit ribosomal protein S11